MLFSRCMGKNFGVDGAFLYESRWFRLLHNARELEVFKCVLRCSSIKLESF